MFVDSGAWIAFFSADDAHHAEADAQFRRLVRDRTRIITTNLVVAEVQRFLLFRAGIRAARTAILKLEASPTVELAFATAEHHRAAHGWLAKLDDQAISYTDAVSFSVMEAASLADVVCFDHDFVVAGFVPVPPPE